MSVVLPTLLPEDNTKYNILFKFLQPKINVQIQELIRNTAVGNNTNPKKLEQLYAALIYVFVLNMLETDNALDGFWRIKMEYDKIKNCFNQQGINLDELIGLI